MFAQVTQVKEYTGKKLIFFRNVTINAQLV